MNPKSSIYADFLDIELLSRLPSLEVRSQYLMAGFMSGIHRSPYRGSGVEFKEYRDYQPGDPLKLIDWKAYARSDRLYAKLREEETNLTSYLLLDRSESMSYKGPDGYMTKWDFARSLVGAFLLFLSRQGDSTALGFFGNGLEDFTKRGTSTSHYIRLMNNLHSEANRTASNLGIALEALANIITSRSMIVIFSDLYESPNKMQQPISYFRHLDCDVIFFHILDPMEIDFTFGEPVHLQEMETGSRLLFNPDLIRDDYQQKLKEHRAGITQLVRDFGCDYLMLRTDEVPIRALGAYLSARKVFT